MSNIKRYYIQNSIIFLTSITRNRNRLFSQKENTDLLLQIIKSVKLEIPFEIYAFVILPDHFHFLVRMKGDYVNFSKVLQLIKGRFTHNYKKTHGLTGTVSLWQRRFWDHIIRNEKDLRNHLDYIHWNPVKHGYVVDPGNWDKSSFKSWIENGFYDEGWGLTSEPDNIRKLSLE